MSKYSFSLTQRIRGMVEWKLEHYLEDKKQIEEYKRDMMPSFTGKLPYEHKDKKQETEVFGLNPLLIKGNDTGRPTEETALKLTTNAYLIETERSIQAIDRVLKSCDNTDKQLIRLIYWERSYNAVGAGVKIGLTKTPTYSRINNIICKIALELGYVSF